MSFDCSTLRTVWKLGSSIFLLLSLLPLQEISAHSAFGKTPFPVSQFKVNLGSFFVHWLKSTQLLAYITTHNADYDVPHLTQP